jgi:DNA mismatch repair protein MutL
VHPTKQEIKFQDDKIVYAFVQSAVRHALAQFSITPTLDFDLDPSIQSLDAVSKPVTERQKEQAGGSSLFRTFTQKNQAHFIERNSDAGRWQDFFHQNKTVAPSHNTMAPAGLPMPEEKEELTGLLLQLHKTYVVVERVSGMMLIHQRHAHERVLYERFTHAVAGKPIPIQQSLFPVTFELSPADAVLLTELLPDMKELGYQLETFGQHTFIIQGTPSDVPTGGEKSNIEFILEQFKLFSAEIKLSKREKLIRSMAVQQAVRPGTMLSQKEMQQLVADLFACENPQTTADGRIVFVRFDHDQLDNMFGY